MNSRAKICEISDELLMSIVIETTQHDAGIRSIGTPCVILKEITSRNGYRNRIVSHVVETWFERIENIEILRAQRKGFICILY